MSKWHLCFIESKHYSDISQASWCHLAKQFGQVTTTGDTFCCALVPTGLPISLTNWGRVTHICVSELNIIGSDNGLSPGRRQAIIWNNTGLLLIEPLGTNFIEISIGIQTFSFKKMHLNMSSAKWRPSCLGLNVLRVPSLTLGQSHYLLDPARKSHNASDKYPTIQHFFATEMCTFMIQSGALWDIEWVHGGICESGLLP